MATWRFYQGLRTEWRWYRLDDGGTVLAESDRGFAELRACMANAETAGFKGSAYQVQVRQAGAFFSEAERGEHAEAQELTAGSFSGNLPDEASP
jgi:hypothetical protein